MDVSGTNISMIRGDAEAMEISIEDKNGVPIPLVAGDIIYFTVKESTETTEKILQKVIIDFPAGKGLITIHPADTRNLEAKIYTYDVQRSKANGDVRTVVPPSQFMIRGDVTYE